MNRPLRPRTLGIFVAVALLFVFGSLINVRLTAQVWAGGTLVVCDGIQEPPSLDPHREFTEKSHTIIQQIYDGLVQFNADGEIEPALATEWHRVDPLRMRFQLREKVVFHNGEPFTAEAVCFSINRYHHPDINFPAIGFLDSIAEVEVVDSHTVDIVTRYPDGLLLNRLAALVWIVPPQYVQEHGPEVLMRRPIGTGAFQFKHWEPEQHIELAANPDYWLPKRPRLDSLVFRFVPSEKQVELLLAGEVDLVTELPGTLTTQVESAAHARVIKRESFWTVGATMRTSDGPLADVRVRRALNLAIDREALIRFDVRGNGSILASLTMEGEEGHNPELEPYEHDPDEARRLLDEAGVERPLVLRTLVRAHTDRTAQILAAQFRQIGVVLDIEKVYSDAEVIRGLASEHWDLAIAGLPDPMAHSYFIQSILLFSQSPFSLQNDPTFDQKLVEMVQTLNSDERDRLGRELDAYVHDQALSLFTFQKIKTYGVKSDVQFEPYVTGMPYFFNVERQAGSQPDSQVSD